MPLFARVHRSAQFTVFCFGREPRLCQSGDKSIDGGTALWSMKGWAAVLSKLVFIIFEKYRHQNIDYYAMSFHHYRQRHRYHAPHMTLKLTCAMISTNFSLNADPDQNKEDTLFISAVTFSVNIPFKSDSILSLPNQILSEKNTQDPASIPEPSI